MKVEINESIAEQILENLNLCQQDGTLVCEDADFAEFVLKLKEMCPDFECRGLGRITGRCRRIIRRESVAQLSNR